MKPWALLLLVILSACTPTQQYPERSQDYVLVEFAAKLEEDYEKNGGAALK